jgi:hypothetical protein
MAMLRSMRAFLTDGWIDRFPRFSDWLVRTQRLTLTVTAFAVLALLLATTTWGLTRNHYEAGHPTPTVTVTRTIQVSPAQPAPTVTQYVAVSDGSGSNSWIAIAAVGTAIAGIGTLLGGFAAVMAFRRRADDKRGTGTERRPADAL